jgi:hypothetical protein
MEWFINNWGWLIAGFIILVMVSKIFSKNNHKTQVSRQEAQALIVAIVQAFDTILADRLGNKISSTDRIKIATGMVLIMAKQNISLERLQNRPDLFAEIAAESMLMLARSGELSLS